MKRAHDDISPPTNGDEPTKSSAEVAAGNGGLKGKEPASPPAQSSAAAAEAATTPSAQQRKKCPYLDTINRNVLDFDFEKVWNTLQAVGVYLCRPRPALSSQPNQLPSESRKYLQFEAFCGGVLGDCR